MKVMKFHALGQQLFIVPEKENAFSVLSRCSRSREKFLGINNMYVKKKIITVYVQEFIPTYMPVGSTVTAFSDTEKCLITKKALWNEVDNATRICTNFYS
jgi:hypothetical protein